MTTVVFTSGIRCLFHLPHRRTLIISRLEVSGEWVYATVRDSGAKRTYLWNRATMGFDVDERRRELTVADREQVTFSIRMLSLRACRDLSVILNGW